MPFPSQLEEWKDSQSPAAKGCGCAALVGIGGLAFAVMSVSSMGDYGGPPEGAAANSRLKGTLMLVSFVVLVLCFIIGRWLVGKGEPYR